MVDYRDAAAIIFVVDSNDTARIQSAREELDTILSADGVHNPVLLVLANKQDAPRGAMSVSQITDALGLEELKGRWHIQVRGSFLRYQL